MRRTRALFTLTVAVSMAALAGCASGDPGAPTPAATPTQDARALPAECYNDTTREVLPCVVPTPRAQHLHVAVMDNAGGSSWTDEQILSGLQAAADYWTTSLPGFLMGMDVVEVEHYTSALVEQHLADGIGCGIATGAAGPLPAGWSDAGTIAGPLPEAAALFPGADFTWATEDVLVVVLPSSCANPSGEYIGEAGAQGPVDGSGPGNTVVWQVGVAPPGIADVADFDVRILTHELGHVLGLEHTATGWCESADPGCRNARERPDPTNIMGTNTYGLLTTAQRSQFGLVAAGEVETLELADGTDSVTHQYTIQARDLASGLRSVRVVLPGDDDPSDPFDQPITYWLDFLPGLPPGAVQADHVSEIRQSSGLLVQRFIRGDFGHGLWYDLVAENDSHNSVDFHLFQPGETYVNFDGSVSVNVDAMDAAAGLTITVTLNRI